MCNQFLLLAAIWIVWAILRFRRPRTRQEADDGWQGAAPAPQQAAPSQWARLVLRGPPPL